MSVPVNKAEVHDLLCFNLWSHIWILPLTLGWSRHKPFRFEGGTQTSLLHGQNVKKLTVVSFSILILVCMYSLRWELESGLANSNQWVPQPAGPGSEAGQESETIRASEPEDRSLTAQSIDLCRAWLYQQQDFCDLLRKQKLSQHFILYCLAIITPTCLPTAILKLKEKTPEKELEVRVGRVFSVWWTISFSLRLIPGTVGEMFPPVKTSHFPNCFLRYWGCPLHWRWTARLTKPARS